MDSDAADILAPMPRPRAALRRACAAVLAATLGGLVLVLAAPGPASASRAEEQTPIAVTIDSLTPSALTPRRPGTVTVTGTVTNTDAEPWLDVRLYPFVSSTPMTTTDELADAADTEETVEVGGRITADKILLGDLQPGQVVPYTMIVPRSDLPSDVPGVYWFGVHALGSGPEGDDGAADGRARTFLPLLRGRNAPVRAAVLVPLRAHVLRNPDGSVATLQGWSRILSPGGRLDRVRAAGTSSGGGALSWLVDPALLDALRQLAAGNPPRDIAPTEKPSDDPGESPSPSPSPSPETEETPSPDPQTTAVATLAQQWLDAMLPVLEQSEVLALPYGDLDLSAAAAHDPDAYETARTRSIALFEDLGIPATQVNAPPRGVVGADALAMTDTATPMVLSDAALPDDVRTAPGAPPAVVTAGGWRVPVTSSEAASGGPGPGNRLADVALRQRILAEGAVRALDPSHPPLVVMLPERWRPTDPAGFVAGLGQPWFQVSGLTAATAAQLPTTVDPGTLRYPPSAARDQLSGARFSSADALVRSGRSLQRVLARNETVASEVVDEALTTLGYGARGSVSDPAASSRGWIETQLGQIRVQGPSAVTLSGSSGRFAATIVNGLGEPVTVAIHAQTDPRIEVSAPRSVQVAGSSRMTVILQTSNAHAGVHDVTLQLVDSKGEPIGGSTYVRMRSAQVSRIIWAFLGVGGALLFGAIAVRLVRRVRAARTPDVPEGAAPPRRAPDQVIAHE